MILARRGEGRWYVAGINGAAIPQKFTLDLSELSVRSGTLISDGDSGNLSFRREKVRLAAGRKLDVILPPRGGFVMVL